MQTARIVIDSIKGEYLNVHENELNGYTARPRIATETRKAEKLPNMAKLGVM